MNLVVNYDDNPRCAVHKAALLLIDLSEKDREGRKDDDDEPGRSGSAGQDTNEVSTGTGEGGKGGTTA